MMNNSEDLLPKSTASSVSTVSANSTDEVLDVQKQKQNAEKRDWYQVPVWLFAVGAVTLAVVILLFGVMAFNLNRVNRNKLDEAILNHQELITTVAQMKQDIATMQSEQLTLQTAIASLTGERDTLQVTVDGLKQTKAEIDAYYEEYKLKKDTLEKEYATRQEGLVALNDKIAAAQRDFEKQSVELADLQSKVKSNRELEVQNRKLTQEQDALERNKSRLETEIAALEGKVKDRET